MTTPSVAQVLQWEQSRRDAALAGDVAALGQLMGDTLAYVHSNAACDSRDSYLQKIATGTIRYLTLEFADLQVRLSPGAALVTGQMRATVHRDGQDRAIRSVFLTVWLPDGTPGRAAWTLASHQGTALPI